MDTGWESTVRRWCWETGLSIFQRRKPHTYFKTNIKKSKTDLKSISKNLKKIKIRRKFITDLGKSFKIHNF